MTTTTKLTQPEIIINHIVKYGELTCKMALNLYDIAHLPSKIYLLKAQGFEFVTREVSRGERGRAIVAYNLTEDHRTHALDVVEYNRLYSKLRLQAIQDTHQLPI
jgi:hypothetical protein